MKSIEAEYGVTKRKVKLYKKKTQSGKVLHLFDSPGEGLHVKFGFPEFKCHCPRTGHPDFATITIAYCPAKVCVEIKSLKYYYNSFDQEGHFHEQVTRLIAEDLVGVLKPKIFHIKSEFNTRGGTTPVIEMWWTTDSKGKGYWL